MAGSIHGPAASPATRRSPSRWPSRAPSAPSSWRPRRRPTPSRRWTGGVNLYRSGVFTTQKTWLWCTAADIQIIRNIVRGTTDHSTKNQRRYFEWMRKHNRYDLPLSAGVDRAGLGRRDAPLRG